MSETSTPAVGEEQVDAKAEQAEAPKTEGATAETAKKHEGPIQEKEVWTVLERVIDPELHMNIVELGLIYKVELKSEEKPDIEVEMTLTSPGCPYGPVIMGQVPSVLKAEYDDAIGDVNVSLTFSPPWDPATMASEDVKFELGIF